MRVGLNLLYLIPGEVGGTETYGVSLVDAMVRLFPRVEFAAYVNEESRGLLLPVRANLTSVRCEVRAKSRRRRYQFEQFRLPTLAREHRMDILHSLGYVSCLLSPCPSVVTMHDVHVKNGRAWPWTKRMVRWLFEPLSAKRSDAVIAPSQFSKQEIVSCFGISPDVVFVVHEAPKMIGRGNPEYVDTNIPRQYGVDGPYVLAFSSTSLHKNTHRLIQAFEAIAEGCRHDLVLVGHVSQATGGVLRSVPDAIRGRIKTVGYVPDAHIPAILKQADLMVFPSWYEGFGLPALEAQMYGVPLACSEVASLPEVAGDGAVYFDPYSVEDIGRTMLRCLVDRELCEELRRRGLKNASRFSWDKAARETMEVYTRVLKRRGRELDA